MNSVRNITISNVGSGFDVRDGTYPGWCIQDHVNGTTPIARLYSSYDPNLPLDVRVLPWGQINYLLNHKQGDARAVQTAMWLLLGSPDPDFGLTTTALDMANAAAAHPDFKPGPGQIVAVIVYSDGMMPYPQSTQEVIIEVPVLPVTPAQTVTPAVTPPITLTSTVPVTTGTTTPPAVVTTPGLTTVPVITTTPGVNITTVPVGGTTPGVNITTVPAAFTTPGVSITTVPAGGPTPGLTVVSTTPTIVAGVNRMESSLYVFGFDFNDWLLLLLALILLALLLLLLLLALFGRRVSRYYLRRGPAGRFEEEVNTTNIVVINEKERENLKALLAESAQRRYARNEVVGLQQQLSERSREAELRRLDLDNALLSIGQERQAIEKLKGEQDFSLFVEQQEAENARVQGLDMAEQYQLEIMLANLYNWEQKLAERKRAHTFFCNTLRERQEKHAELLRSYEQLEDLNLRMQSLHRRLEAGEISENDREYQELKRLAAETTLQLEGLKQLDRTRLSPQEHAEIQAELKALLADINLFSHELLLLRRQIKQFKLRLTRPVRLSEFSLDNVEPVPIKMIQNEEIEEIIVPAAQQVRHREAQVVVTGERQPLIDTGIIQRVMSGGTHWFVVVRVRNPYPDIVFGSMNVELSVTLQSDRQANQSALTLYPSKLSEFGDVGYVQTWLTREVEISGVKVERDEFLVCVIASWIVQSSATALDYNQDW